MVTFEISWAEGYWELAARKRQYRRGEVQWNLASGIYSYPMHSDLQRISHRWLVQEKQSQEREFSSVLYVG